MADEKAKPRVLVFGGTGFVGRHLTTHLVENDLASKIRIVDKVPPAMAWLNDKHKAAFGDARVEFKSANLSSSASVTRSFEDESGGYDYVVCLAAETKFGQAEAVYKERVFNVTINCAKESAKRNVKRFVEVSTGRVYSPSKPKARKEDGKIEPWTPVASEKRKAEIELGKIDGLNHVILRPAVIYGTGDRLGITPRLVIGSVYRELKETMKLLWGKELKINTVHVSDVCRAIWHLTQNGPSGEVYNVVDKANTDQGRISSLVSEIFKINHDFFGTLASSLAKLSLSNIQEDSNDKHLDPWSKACTRDNVATTPLSPYLDKELLANKHLCIDGSKIEGTGFEYKVREPTVALFREIVDDYVKLGLFPPSLVP
ncbi:dTDP-glucose 4,6-dehydratase-like [Oscarella lobularis]|uniref:dTDP-glucose 4,6-dehydratase-like n=1 Tax=Oscarella lobularis TaxID=121494 RepID=UPI003313B57B